MKTIEYKGWTIDKFTHPKLQGRYSLYDNNGVEVCRAHTLKEAKTIISKTVSESKKTYRTKYGRYTKSEIEFNIESNLHFSKRSNSEKDIKFYTDKSNYFKNILETLCSGS